ncbi:hypothetical protein [Halofilum ochraceum]|uniref:hypothetical protein n=1 Tax=Halofilum ochraceum TaxID=1611323 RepID=UPI0008DA6B95|nr:hypothetical protein [Halofilum ochraceum]
MNHNDMGDRDSETAAEATRRGPASLRDEVLEQLSPPRRAILAQHARDVPDDDIVWGLALVLADFHQDARTDSRRVRAEMAEFGDLLQGWHGHMREELDHTTKRFRRSILTVLRENEERDRTAMEKAIDACLDQSIERIIDARLTDLLRVVSGKVLALLGFAFILGGVTTVIGMAAAAGVDHM